MNSRQQSPPSKLHDSILLMSSQTPSPIQKGSQAAKLVVVKTVVVEVVGMVLSDSVESGMLEDDMLASVLDIEVEGSVTSELEVNSEVGTDELSVDPCVDKLAIDDATSEVDDSSETSCVVIVDISGLVEYKSWVVVDGEPEDENIEDSSGVVMLWKEELDGCSEVESVVENEKVVLVMSMHWQSVQKSVMTTSRQQSPPS